MHAMTRHRLLAAATLLFALALLLHGPIPQWSSYHEFADRRTWLGVPNAADVLSNLPFLLIGAWAWAALRDAPWRLFALAIGATAFGSAGYHWAPDNASLVFDRVPIAAACALLACLFLAERVDPRWARPAVLGAALLAGAASVLLWWLSEQAGRGDLRAYLFVQFLPMVLVVAGLALRLRPLTGRGVSDAAWWTTLALYAAAKAFELADQAVLHASGGVSGHTLKHLLAAAAAAWLLRAAIRSGSPR